MSKHWRTGEGCFEGFEAGVQLAIFVPFLVNVVRGKILTDKIL